MTDAQGIIATLGMQPHPEGGHFVETFRDADGPDENRPGGRGHCTSIYFLLQAGEVSHWHRVDATEIWLWHDGAPLALSIASEGQTPVTHRLGADIATGDRPQAIVPKRAWQSACTLGSFSLVSCVVAPGFVFEGFELAPKGWSPPEG